MNPQPTEAPSRLLPKYVRVLNALRKGATVPLKGYNVVMGESPTGAPQLGIACTEPAGTLMALNVEINTFIQWCEELDEVDIPILIPQLK